MALDIFSLLHCSLYEAECTIFVYAISFHIHIGIVKIVSSIIHNNINVSVSPINAAAILTQIIDIPFYR